MTSLRPTTAIRFHRFRQHAFSLMLLLAVGTTVAGESIEQDIHASNVGQAWADWLAQDLVAARKAIEDHYIYAVLNADDPAWDRLVMEAFTTAEKEAESVNNLAGYQAVMQGLLARFEDTHLRARFSINTQSISWPGFLVRYQLGEYRISQSTDPSISVGAIVSQCDGRPIGDWIRDLAPRENHLADVPATAEWLAPQLFVHRGHGFLGWPSSCRINGMDIELNWQSTTHDRLKPLQKFDDTDRPTTGLTRFGDGLAWIRLPSMAPRTAQDAKAFHDLISQLPSLRQTPQVVLDVRGNGGGPYPWFMAMLRALYGDRAVDYYATARLEIRPLFVDGTYQQPSKTDPVRVDPFNTPKDLPLNRAVETVQSMRLDNGKTLIALEPSGERYQRPASPGPSLFTGMVYVLTDAGCASACLSMIDELKRLGQMIHIGTPPWVDKRSGSPRPYALPSTLTTLLIPSMLREYRQREDNATWMPDVTLPVDTQSTKDVRHWLSTQAIQVNAPGGDDLRTSTIRRSHRGRFNQTQIKFDSLYEEFVVADGKQRPAAILSGFSYIADPQQASSSRPVIFVFQGGPGSSSLWSHLGLLGPKRIRMDDPAKPQTVPPFTFEDNPYSLLDVADLVFIDPVHTGFSRPLPDASDVALLTTQDDAASVADFIRQWLTRHQRWNVPRYVMGSSYGTTRAIEVASTLMGGVLPPHGQLGAVTLNGLIILGPVFSRQQPFAGNHRAFQTMLPTYAATAWYHGQLDSAFTSVEQAAQAAEAFAWGDYDDALDLGFLINDYKRVEVANALAELTGIDAQTWVSHDLKIDRDTFRGLLLQSRNQSIGRFDGRFVLQRHLVDADPVVDDAAMGQYTPAFVSTFNDYLTSYLGASVNRPYQTIDWRTVNFQWDYGWGRGIQRPRNDAETLAKVQRRTPMMRVFIGAGYYDLGTPYAAAQYALAHVPLDRDRTLFNLYPSGHSPYLGEENIATLSQDLRGFITP